ncbi:unnamed protein product [Protopolystoma xenopodis]|uniref:Carboxylesterase type B domain-containing protein n=1 Tax=Protopolystoma xenopodis TaxID=117903 RepID=A0A448WKQ6_9PLAT|nr:unnamed protein product [Protopolystoma xenopodis]
MARSEGQDNAVWQASNQPTTIACPGSANKPRGLFPINSALGDDHFEVSLNPFVQAFNALEPHSALATAIVVPFCGNRCIPPNESTKSISIFASNGKARGATSFQPTTAFTCSTVASDLSYFLDHQAWLGVPYAQPPTRERGLRFRPPRRLETSREPIDNQHLPPSCSQPVTKDPRQPAAWQRLVPQPLQTEAEALRTSEDCLYLNIYALNDTQAMRRPGGAGLDAAGGGTRWASGGLDGSAGRSDGRAASRSLSPVVVFLNGYDHVSGTGNRYPGHALAQLGLVVVTVNYRLGPFGFLATREDVFPEPRSGSGLDDNEHGKGRKENLSQMQGDEAEEVWEEEEALGNYGLLDQVMALEFIQENIDRFMGDPNQVKDRVHWSTEYIS